VKPKGNEFGDPENPTPVVSSAGVLKGTSDATLVAPFNNLPAVERLFAAHPGEIAAILIEPIMMNIAFCMPDEGYIHAVARRRPDLEQPFVQGVGGLEGAIRRHANGIGLGAFKVDELG